MDSMKKLEQRWYFYKIRKSLLSLNKFAFVGMLGLGGYYLFLNKHMLENLFTGQVLMAKGETKKVVPEVVVKSVHLVNSPVEVVKRVEAKKVVIASKNEIKDASALYEVSLDPVIPIIDMEKENRKSTSTRTHRARTKVSSSRNKHPKLVKAKASTYLTARELLAIKEEIKSKETPVLNTEKIKKINLNGSSANYIETMKQKFSSSRNPREALLLAKAFYINKEYSKSEKWALTANKIDSTKDESWHIFAKSKAKLGQRDEALKILVSYYKKSHSSKTKALIVKIKSGRF